MSEAERQLGSPIAGVEVLSGGYTAQQVFRLRLRDGDTWVLKAAPPAEVDRRLDWPAELGREIVLYAKHPELDPWRPRYGGDFEAQGWRGLLMEDLSGGQRPPPWTDEAIDCVAAGLAAMHRALRDQVLIHGDVRSDNLFLVPNRGLVLVDWAEAAPGAGLKDAAYWAAGVELEGATTAFAALARYLHHVGGADPEQVAHVVAELLELTVARLKRPGQPWPVRELRLRELEVLRRWHQRLAVR